jgi:ATP-dependent DNA helicase PIF1
MLLRNLDQKLGLCNETRLIITRMGKYVLEGKNISGSNIGDKVFILQLIQDIFLFKIALGS